ncbi:alpha-glucuronidase family glycosyl hydrolase [Marinoscillum sp.]|uniref:alpha-glucuronidase family glycosyl hydrolase n=1 Tax=Marinoscillum sp. TaxID=2024838 RepID=UPI003BA87101
MKISIQILFITAFLLIYQKTTAQDGYKLWLRYDQITNPELLDEFQATIGTYTVSGTSPTHQIIRNELELALPQLLGKPISAADDGSILITKNHPKFISDLKDLGEDGYLIKKVDDQIIVTSDSDIGLLYGTFGLLRHLQTQQSIKTIDIVSQPKIQRRILNHWDNLDRTSERGYAGFSIWDWHKLPLYIDQRYLDYARANASIGINGAVLTNVNANALILTPSYLEKVKALADAFRPYGIKVYLTARFSAPIEIGGLETADPLNDEVINWWNEKVEEVYNYIPDFGGFLVKANSEGQPGPQNYGRSHAEGANMLAKALQPFNGIVMWRAFVYSNEEPEDRAKQAYNEFMPLDGKFEENVVIQVKNGAIDFQPREPFHPLFGAMKQTPLAMEFQITQEYLGQATQLVYLAPMYKEVLDSDTYAKGEGSEVSKTIDGTLYNHDVSAIAGVANIGTDLNWTGHPFAQANWYTFGRLAWDHSLSSESIADEWIQMTWSQQKAELETIKELMMTSWPASVNYMTPLGLHHLMGTGHHYGPAPWVDNLPRADWNPVYYHKATADGIGFDRTRTGSDAVDQYFPAVSNVFNDPNKCPEKYLLWFHHLSWDYEMKSGNTLWNEIALRYQKGIDQVRNMQAKWNSLEDAIDPKRHTQVKMLLYIQEQEAIWWKDACLLYFQQFSDRAIPDTVEPPEKTLTYYKSLRFPYAPGH